MEKKNRFYWKFFLGLTAGAAAGLYLNSDRGRRMRQETGERLTRWGADVSGKAREEMTKLSKRASQAINHSKEYADKTSENLKEKITRFSKAAEEMVDRTEHAYEKAADWAAEKLDPNINGK
jgi:gas vesicle protein